ncbi:uncharacterized protein LOC132708412 [Cylas formicarius]|uniref:uncharacterized protein LOC132708412 n=1 Tax=Cylas formicarius TaxID=197179 RepID=UPI002958B358|nr:uncharacterized protein LOC132708412 [Cylas formicarius]
MTEANESLNAKSLINKRGILKARLTKFESRISQFEQQEISLSELKLRLKKIEETWEEFDKIQSELEILDASQVNERDVFEDNYFRVVSKASTMTESLEKLAMASRQTESPIQQSYLKGEAAQLLHSLELSETNYDVAIELLKERFENKKMLIHNHMKNLFDLAPVPRESHVATRKLIDTIQRNTRALQNLNEPVNHWDTPIIFVTISKLDNQTRKEWEASTTKITSPKLEDLLNFLKNKCQLLETIDNKSASKDKTHSHVVTNNEKHSNQSKFKFRCSFCKQDTHVTYRCRKLLAMSIKKRLSELKRAQICTNCLQIGHKADDCKGKTCQICNKRHNTMLHDPDFKLEIKINENVKNNEPQIDNISEDKTVALTSNFYLPNKNQVLLATAVIKVLDSDNKFISCRALLDSGSQSNFCTKEFFERLKLPGKRLDLSISGINGSPSNICCQVDTQLISTDNKYQASLPLLVVDQITSELPQYSFDVTRLSIPSHLHLADDCFNISQSIDVLLGATIFFDILNYGQMKLGKKNPILQNTKLGWVLAGPMQCNGFDNKSDSKCFLNVDKLSRQIEKFWQLENVDNPHSKLSNEELDCEIHFRENTRVNSNGQYEVKLPLKDSYVELGQSLPTAIKRLHFLEKRLARAPDTEAQYISFLREYEKMGHMTRLTEREINEAALSYYIPHHVVFKDQSCTTRARVVFDASCVTSTGLSLNEVMKLGPKVQSDLFDIIVRMRTHKIVLTADIEKMYRMVSVNKIHRPLQRIIWREDHSHEIAHFNLNTVTYGLKSSSFLATRTLNEIGRNSTDPKIRKIIMEDFYIDDLISGAENVSDAIKLKQNVSATLLKSGFNLRKWRSNDLSVLENDNFNTNSEFCIRSSEETKTLGVIWDPISDTLCYAFNLSIKADLITKRSILSGVAQLFDPLGLINPCVVKAKLILQQLWQIQADWDSEVPQGIKENWSNFLENLHSLNDIKIDRKIFSPDYTKIALHGFCDSSMHAYGACIYALSENSYGERKSNLICAKSKLAPLKTQTLPRLELSSALLLSQLMSKVVRILRVPISSVTCWTDSMITLSWINSEPNKWKTFVSNRVSEIQILSENSSWKHIESENNPADIISRGLNLSELKNCQKWFQGPTFPIEEESSWPKTHIVNMPDLLEARKENIILSFTLLNNLGLIERFSTYRKLIRITAYVLRFGYNLRHKKARRFDTLLQCELDNAITKLCINIQHQVFQTEIKCLNSNQNIPKGSKLLALSPFIDEIGLLRVGGRLKNSHLAFNHKHPIVLPSKHHFTRLLIEHYHRKYLHAGTQFILERIREDFWPLNAKNQIRSVLRKCMVCFRVKPFNISQQMGSLPQPRVTPSRPFTFTGIDLAGPYFTKASKTRTKILIKTYLTVFVCLSSKAVHIEIITDLTSEAFMDAFKRFVSRRGLPKHLYSDNAKNFVGTNNIFHKFYESVAQTASNETQSNYFLENRITWHFIPARSPHHGGIWESAIKSFKNHLQKVMGETKLNYEQLYTVVVQIEAILNSRPLLPLSSDPTDLQSLTPGHLLIGGNLLATPQHDVTEIPSNRLKNFHQLHSVENGT